MTINDTGNLTLPVGTAANRPTVNATSQSFTTVGSTTWTCPAGVTQIEVMVVAGGGGGGGRHGAGGGAGGLIYNSNYPVTPTTTYTVVVGGGGAGGPVNVDGTNGNNSSFGPLVAIGGGGGATYTNAGKAGGSGGGDARTPDVVAGRIGGAGTLGQGHAGGGGATDNNFPYSHGGGGGAGEPGYRSPFAAGRSGNGGNGLAYSISGTTTWYAGGGGGGGHDPATAGAIAIGGMGGGGPGGARSLDNPGVAGTANTGGGGGGASTTGGGTSSGGNGGSGIVIIRYSLTASSTIASAQTRFNSAVASVETYGSGAWGASTGAGGVITKGLIVHFDPALLASGSTTLTDLSGNGNTGTLTNGAAYNSDNGGCVLLDGSNDYINTTYSSSYAFANAVFSWDMWFYVGTMTSGAQFVLVSKSTYESGNRSYESSVSFDGTNTYINFGYHDGSSWSYLNSTYNKVNQNSWNHVAVTISGTFGIIFCNGAPTFTNAAMTGSVAVNTVPLQIGAYVGPSNNGAYFNGKIGPVRVYGRNLSHDEIIQNYNAQAARFQKAPIVVYPNAKAIQAQNPNARNGFYMIRTAEMNYAVNVYCDMENYGGGWMLCSYGFVGSWNIPNMNHNAQVYPYNPENRATAWGLVQTVADQRTAVKLHRSATETLYAAGGNPSQGGIDGYTYVYKFNLPSPETINFNNHNFDQSSGFPTSTVTVTALKGELGTSTKYTFRDQIGATWSDTFPTGYGAVAVSNPRGFNNDGGPFFPSVHSGSQPRSSQGFNAGPDVVGGSQNYSFRGWYGAGFVNGTGQMSIWVR
jgi:hypothetical protein